MPSGLHCLHLLLEFSFVLGYQYNFIYISTSENWPLNISCDSVYGENKSSRERAWLWCTSMVMGKSFDVPRVACALHLWSAYSDWTYLKGSSET